MIRSLLVPIVIEMAGFWCAAIPALAQVATVPQEQVLLSKLSPPIFPPLARAARVSGDVEIALRIRKDGTVESVEVVRGHPLLKPAALESARQSKFECHDCRDTPAPYSLLYTFEYTTTQHCCQSQEKAAVTAQTTEPQAGVTHYKDHITILIDPFCICDPSADVVKVRSAKCLFLWHCSTR